MTLKSDKKRNGAEIHVCVSFQGLPLTFQIASEKAHDKQYFILVIENIKIKTIGNPRTRPIDVLADSAYDDGTNI